MANPAAAAASAKTALLYATRIGGRCSTRCMIATAEKPTSTPALQQKSRIDERTNTNDSETPPASVPSSGTGKRSASVHATSSAAIEINVDALCDNPVH